MAKKIRISGYSGQSDGANLNGYYFEERAFGGGYNFYAPNGGNPLNTGLITSASRSFQITIPQGQVGAGLKYSMSVTTFPAVETMTGTWDDTQQELTDIPGSGTFQAQASGSGEDESEDSATAATA